MNAIKNFFKRDNFFWGALIGVALPAVAFIIIRSIASAAGNDDYQFIKPFGEDRMQVYAIIANLIPFRIYMINMHYDKTGRGILFSTFFLVIAYFIAYFSSGGSIQ